MTITHSARVSYGHINFLLTSHGARRKVLRFSNTSMRLKGHYLSTGGNFRLLQQWHEGSSWGTFQSGCISEIKN